MIPWETDEARALELTAWVLEEDPLRLIAIQLGNPEAPAGALAYKVTEVMSTVVPLAVRVKSADMDMMLTKEVRDLTFRTVAPGGFASCEISLDRPIERDPPELQRFADVMVYDGRSGAIVWQGRLEDLGRGAGPQGQVWQLNVLGPMAHARDRTVPLIYVDKGMARWVPYTPPATSTGLKTSTLADEEKLRAEWVKGTNAPVGDKIGHQYSLALYNQHIARWTMFWVTGANDSDWRSRVRMGAGDLNTVEYDVTTSPVNDEVTVTQVITTDYSATFDSLAVVLERVAGSGAALNDSHWITWADIILMGTRYKTDGTEDTAGASYGSNTVLASDIVKDLLGRLLNQYDGVNAVIATTGYAIDQLAYPDGANAEQVLADLLQFESGFLWEALEDTASGKARFLWRAWPVSVRYEASAVDGFQSPGSATELYNAVTVRYVDEAGRTRQHRATQAVKELDDAGLTREELIDLGSEAGSLANATQAAAEFLAQHAVPPNAGTLKVSRAILDRVAGRMVMPWELRPGYLIRVRDVHPRVDALNDSGRDGVTVFRVVAVTYNAERNEATLELDSPARTVESFLARVQARQVMVARR
jgi:hypothetical protein